ncbi:SDR family NAD(P)-dependent oxidoreductase [Dechloromonas sp. ARDL1]|uniref:SDR family NAD(P)-dependent oxidoreductase n=1 Tax=Dechloromonas sp. ARDL1 TaxID=3322121 RepID=UPI003DA7437C
MNSQSRKTVIVTGASSGIGFAIARRFLERGDNVVANARTLPRLQAAFGTWSQSTALRLVAGDIGDPATATRLFRTAVDSFGRVDTLINNAGIFVVKPFADYGAEDIAALLDTNLKGFLYPAQEAARVMSAQKSGQIISITASIAEQPYTAVPATLPILIKGGINHATRALAIELAAANVRVNAVAPGIIDTPLHLPENHGFLAGMQPLGRIGRPDDIVDAVVYLADSDFTTGAILPVDGGMSAGRW